jgi:galactokinase
MLASRRREAQRVKFFDPSQTPAEGLGVLVLFRLIEESVPAFFRADRRILIARAPGRLDVMGGFAEYSGSLVLQLPTAEAACVAVQARDDDLVRLWSPCRDGSRTQLLSMRLGELGLPGRPLDFDEASALLRADPADRWAGYLLGALLVLARERGLRGQHGLDVLLLSDVPEGRGVGSSSALAVAGMRAFAQIHGLELSGRELALLCQLVETEIVGRAGTAKDPMTAACAEADELLVVRCQPCELEGSLLVPAELEFIGIDSGAPTAGGAEDRAAVRTAASLGAHILAREPAWRGHLANWAIDDFRARWRAELPEAISGTEFVQRFGWPENPHTRIDPQRTYPLRAATQHPIEENARVERFHGLLQQQLTADRRAQLGEIMFESHAAYGACGLGDATADFLVQQARQRIAAGGQILGAKVTGEGGGGTVVLLGERGKVWLEALRLKKALLQATGHSAHIFRWSSPGALSFGSIELRPAGV